MSGIPKMQLDLDQVMDDHELENPSIADAAVADGVEDEKCVVGQYRTTKQQKQAFASLLQNCDRERIPIEWVIDIADESNGWFYGTAYHYDDNTQMLHVMVPDKLNPTFDGHVQLDHRTVHLIECVDQKSLALFNKIVRDSVLKIKWDVEWYEECCDDERNPVEGEGEWISSVARYYIRIANQLLVEDREYDEHDQEQQASKGFVIITADLNVRLQHCHKNKGIEDFYRLINEGIVSFTPEAEEEANIAIQNLSQASPAKAPKEIKDKAAPEPPAPDTATKDSAAASSSSTPLSLRKLTEVVRHLKDSLLDIVDDYENRRKEELDLAQLYSSFILQGDLEKGLQLMDYFQKVPIRNEKRKAFNRKLSSPSKYGSMDDNEYEENQEENEDLEDDVEERKYRKLLKTLGYASHNSTKLEKQCVKLIKHGYEITSAGGSGGSTSPMKGSSEEFDALKKEYKKLKKDLESKEQEIRVLKNSGIRR